MVNYRKIFWGALLIKAVQFIIIASAFYTHKPSSEIYHYIFVKSKDYGRYTLPSQNLVDEFAYFEQGEHGQRFYALKMPGMVPIYAPLYFFFGKETGMALLVIVQFFADVISVCLLAYIAQFLFSTIFLTYLLAFLYAMNVYVSVFTHHALSELFCTVFMITSLFYLCRMLSETSFKKQIRFIFLSGLFATWSVCFRPVSGILFIIIPSILLWYCMKKQKINWLPMLKILFAFGFAFLLFESIWTVRNYRLTGQFIPLDNTAENFLDSKPAYRSLFPFIQAFGGDVQSWNRESAACWFVPPSDRSNYDKEAAAGNPFPRYLFSERLTMGTLQSLRNEYYAYHDSSLSKDERTLHLHNFTAMADSMTRLFKKEKPFYYTIVAPLQLAFHFVFIPRPYSLPFTGNSFLDKTARYSCFAFYYFIILTGFGGMLLVLFRGPALARFFILIPLIHISAYAFLRYIENRYLVAVYPYFTLFSAHLLTKFTTLFKGSMRS